MFINLYIAWPTYYFILIYTCGLTVVIKRICYVMLPDQTRQSADFVGDSDQVRWVFSESPVYSGI